MSPLTSREPSLASSPASSGPRAGAHAELPEHRLSRRHDVARVLPQRRRMAEAQIAAWDRFGYDVIDLENGTAALAEACGCEVEYPEHEPPRVRPARAAQPGRRGAAPGDRPGARRDAAPACWTPRGVSRPGWPAAPASRARRIRVPSTWRRCCWGRSRS